MKRVHGFTLIELVVTMFILAIIVAAAAPSFNGVMQNVQIDSATSKLRSALSFARSTAVSEQADITICSSNDQIACTGEIDWAGGWLVYEDVDDDGVADADEIQRVWEALPDGTTLDVADTANDLSAIVFEADGRLDTTIVTTLLLEVDGCGLGDSRTLSISPIGRVQVTPGDC